MVTLTALTGKAAEAQLPYGVGLMGMGIPIIKIGRSLELPNLIMEIPIPTRRVQVTF